MKGECDGLCLSIREQARERVMGNSGRARERETRALSLSPRLAIFQSLSCFLCLSVFVSLPFSLPLPRSRPFSHSLFLSLLLSIPSAPFSVVLFLFAQSLTFPIHTNIHIDAIQISTALGRCAFTALLVEQKPSQRPRAC